MYTKDVNAAALISVATASFCSVVFFAYTEAEEITKEVFGLMSLPSPFNFHLFECTVTRFSRYHFYVMGNFNHITSQ